MKIKSVKIISVGLAVFLTMPMLTFAQEEFQIPGRVTGTGTNFEITDSEYLSVSLESSEEITVTLESVPKTINLLTEISFIVTSAELAIEGLEPNTTYYKYEDSYKNEVMAFTDDNGSYNWTQDLTQPHRIWFQPVETNPSALTAESNMAVFLPEECHDYGVWDAMTSTCTLNKNIAKRVEITTNDIILDCAGYSVIGSGGDGIHTINKSGVTVRNCTVDGFSYGIYSYHAYGNIFSYNNIRNNWAGFTIEGSNSNTLIGNIVTNNTWGIFLLASGNILTNNTMSNNGINFSVEGYSDSAFNHNIDTSNMVDGKPIYYIQNAANQVYGSSTNAGTFYCIFCSNVTIKDLTLAKNFFGVFLWKTQNSKVHHNNFMGNNTQAASYYGEGNIFDNNLPDGGNYWLNFDTPQRGCIDANNDKICDAAYTFYGGQDRYPWTTQDGWRIEVNQPPTASNLIQYKSDGITSIQEGQTTTESTVVFKATVSDPDNYDVKFQIELKEFNQPFDGTSIIESDFVSSGQHAQITRYGLVNGQYHWRARAVDSRGAMSDWQEFGTQGNIDFEVKLVPLYTQVRSQYPSDEETDEWDGLQYADGNAGCGFSIAACGCAITSVVMVARYYDVVEAWGRDVNPKEINEWLQNEPGGYQNGDVNWVSAAKYTDWGIQYERTDKTINNYVLLDEKLANNQPVIAKEASGRGGVYRQHFLVIDNKLASTYTVKDPGWYNTKTLSETTDVANQIRGYENGFDGLRIYKKGDGVAQSAIVITIGSPAELLVIDSRDRKLGKDENNIDYSEIPSAWYFEDGFDDPTGANPTSQERNKSIHILDPINGEYQIKIIGTGSGDYTLISTSHISDGESTSQIYKGNTANDDIQEFELSYSATTIQEIQLRRIVDIDIKPGSDPNSINLSSKGTIPVAILTNRFFNAKDIVVDNVRFAGVKPERGKLEDVDNDDDLDLMLHFNTQSLQLNSASTEAVLTGQLMDGALIKGIDSVKIIQEPEKQTAISRILSFVNQLIRGLFAAIGLAVTQ